MKTAKTYSEAIREKYLKDKEYGNLRGGIYRLTPANIRKLCKNLLDENLSLSDKTVLKNYFEIKDFDNIRNKIKAYDIDGFRPICKFLKKENDTIAADESLELIAVLIDFNPRPFTKYRVEDLNQGIPIELKENKSEDVEYLNDSKEGKSTIVVNQKNKRLFVWFSNASASNKLRTILFTIVIFAGIVTATIHVLKNQTRWMIWQDDHYVEVKLDLQKYDINQLKAYKEERILNFKQIIPDCDTKFFKDDGTENLWYGKNKNGELEYFTDLGLHPETGTTLKKITSYMVKKYICHTYQ